MTEKLANEVQFTPSNSAHIPVIRIDGARRSDIVNFRRLWGHRELLYFLIWRESKVRYKQTSIGIAWAIFQPLMTMVIFTIVFGYFAKMPTDGLPYPVFVYTGLVPWLYFSQAVTRGCNSLVGDASLLQKVYFPRVILPVSAVLAPLLDLFCSFLVLVGLMTWYGIAPTWNLVFLPLFVIIAALTALATALWLSPLNVKYRDVIIVIPVIIQLWMYASPVIYPVSLVPEKWQYIYNLNPLISVIAGFRWALVGQAAPDGLTLAVNAITVALLLFGGNVLFKRMEPTLADFV